MERIGAITARRSGCDRHRLDVRADASRWCATIAGAALTKAIPRIRRSCARTPTASCADCRARRAARSFSTPRTCSPRRSTSSATAAPTTASTAATTASAKQQLLRHSRAGLRRGARRRRADGHGLVQQLAGLEGARPPAPAHGRAEEAAWASTASSSATGTASTKCRAARRTSARRRSTPASTCSWCRPIGSTFLEQHARAGARGRDSDGAHRRCGDAHPAREDCVPACSRKAGLRRGRSPTSASCSARRSIASVARQAVRESLVLLKNEHGVLPLRRNVERARRRRRRRRHRQADRRLDHHLAGHREHERRFPRRDVDLRRASRARSRRRRQSDARASTAATPTQPDVAIVVFGEDPYAEWFGDLQVDRLPAAPAAPSSRCCSNCGRRAFRSSACSSPAGRCGSKPELNASRRVRRRVAAGQRGRRHRRRAVPQGRRRGEPRLRRQAVVLVAARPHRRPSLNRNDPGYDPLFPYGFGLRY